MFSQDKWSEPEKWVWQEIRAGRAADFNAHEGRADRPLDPKDPPGWGDARRLRSDFLGQILRQPHSAEIPAQGVRIVGAWLDEAVDLAYGRLAWQLWLERCRFEQPANFAGLQVDGWFSLEGSAFAQEHAGVPSVNLNGADIAGHVSLSGARLNGVELTGAKLGGMLNFDAATSGGEISMSGIVVEQNVFFRKATLNDVDIGSARISGNLEFEDATLNGALRMNGLRIARTLRIRKSDEARQEQLPIARFKAVELISAKIDGDLELTDAALDGELNMDSLVVDGHGYMRGSTFNSKVSLVFARIGRNLDLSDSELTELDLSGTRIEGELRLGSERHRRTRWRIRPGLSLNLRNVHVGALQDRVDRIEDPTPRRRAMFRHPQRCDDAWPAVLQLDGFTYDRLGGFGGNLEGVRESQEACDVDMLGRDVGWYIGWLARDHSYSPQPYEQLARAFRMSGDPTKANRILYESRRRARVEARQQREFGRWVSSLFLDWSIGYGLGGRYFRALGWVVVLTVIGAAVLNFSAKPLRGLEPGLAAQLIYSVDQLLPIVEFEKYDQVDLEGGVAYYFYVQKVMGWMLGSFLVAGLAGLTQRQ
jgi:uncharacterized protein YjbI with pentapeptide repeats